MPLSTPSPAQLDVADALLALLRDSTTEPRPDDQLEALTLAVAADLPVLLWGITCIFITRRFRIMRWVMPRHYPGSCLSSFLYLL